MKMRILTINPFSNIAKENSIGIVSFHEDKKSLKKYLVKFFCRKLNSLSTPRIRTMISITFMELPDLTLSQRVGKKVKKSKIKENTTKSLK
jgi:hypothetical protein